MLVYLGMRILAYNKESEVYQSRVGLTPVLLVSSGMRETKTQRHISMSYSDTAEEDVKTKVEAGLRLPEPRDVYR